MNSRYKVYPEYKDSGSKWLDEIPTHWKVMSLKHVLSTPITDGPHLTPVKRDEGIPFISAEAVSQGYINFGKKWGDISQEDDELFSLKYRPQRHDVYMIKSGATTGVSAIVETDERFNIWSPLAVMRCKSTYNAYFLLNYLRSDSFQKSVQLSWTFGTQQNIGMNTLENLAVCYPPFEEQIQIANFLAHETARIDKLIDKQQQLIKLLKEKRQAVISHAVTKGLNPDVKMKDSDVEWLSEVPAHWQVGRLKFANEIKNNKTDSNGNVIALENIESWTGNFISTNSDFEGSGVAFTEGCILFGKLRPYLAKVYKTKNNGVAFGDLIVFKPRSFVDAQYSFYQMISPEFIREVDSSTYGSKMPRASVDFIREMPFLLPAIDEQQKISSYIGSVSSKFDSLIEKSTQAIKLIQERRTALISSAVTGKIDVRDWSMSKTEASA